MSRFNAGKEKEKIPYDPNCKAFNCPLPGTRTATTRADRDTLWYCRYHFNKDLDDFEVISERVRKALPMIKHLNNFKNFMSTHLISHFYVYPNGDKYNKLETETDVEYYERLWIEVDNYIKGSIGGKVQTVKPVAPVEEQIRKLLGNKSKY